MVLLENGKWSIGAEILHKITTGNMLIDTKKKNKSQNMNSFCALHGIYLLQVAIVFVPLLTVPFLSAFVIGGAELLVLMTSSISNMALFHSEHILYLR